MPPADPEDRDAAEPLPEVADEDAEWYAAQPDDSDLTALAQEVVRRRRQPSPPAPPAVDGDEAERLAAVLFKDDGNPGKWEATDTLARSAFRYGYIVRAKAILAAGPWGVPEGHPERKVETRYYREDGEPIEEYSWVDDPEWFDGWDATRFKVQVWEMRLVEERIEVHGDRGLCEWCQGEGERPTRDAGTGEAAVETCPVCKGSCDGPETPYVVDALAALPPRVRDQQEEAEHG